MATMIEPLGFVLFFAFFISLNECGGEGSLWARFAEACAGAQNLVGFAACFCIGFWYSRQAQDTKLEEIEGEKIS